MTKYNYLRHYLKLMKWISMTWLLNAWLETLSAGMKCRLAKNGWENKYL